jgi:predicted CXXCH cytochrome family protein
MSPVLFAPNDNTLCFTCHAAAGSASVYAGQTAYAASIHATASTMLWPGPTPPARPAGDQGKCLNCHAPHGARDAQGLVPNLEYYREEALCLACHDGSGPATANISAELSKSAAHPTATISGRHVTAEGSSSAAFSATNRHAECTDCHNPHAVTSASALKGASRVSVTNGLAGAAPTYTYVPPTSTVAATEYELCFKCHSSWTTLPAGQKDLAMIFNPANESFHPVESAGKTTSTQLAASLAAGNGLPHLTTSSVIACGDCHNNDSLPRTVTLVSGYTGTVPKGPHGSSASGGNAAFSNAVLRAPYRADLKARAANDDYTANDFVLCFICHSPAPFATGNQDPRTDTAYRFHGSHLHTLFNKGSGAGGITTPGAGQGNAICRECHYNTHGTRGAPWPTNRTYTRGVNFAPNVQGPGGVGEPSWTPGSCRVRCHGTTHNPETY